MHECLSFSCYARSGYSDADFRYDGALDFAMAIGLLDFTNYFHEMPLQNANDALKEKLTRGNAAAVAYTALSLPTVDGKYDCLIEKLIADGTVNRAAASKTIETFRDYGDYVAAVSEFDGKKDYEVKLTFSIARSSTEHEAMESAMLLNTADFVDSPVRIGAEIVGEHAYGGISALKAVIKSEYGRVYTFDFSDDVLNRIIKTEPLGEKIGLPRYKSMTIEVRLADDGEITMVHADYGMTVTEVESIFFISVEMEMK